MAWNSDEFSQRNVKEESENISVGDDPLGDHFEPVIVVTKTLYEGKHDGINNSLGVITNDDSLSEAFHDDFYNENESDNEVVQTGDRDDGALRTCKGLTNSKSENFPEIENPSHVRKKRKIIVVSEEDSVPEKVTIRGTSSRAAKLIAEKALQQYTPEPNDILKSDKASESEASCIEDNEPDTESELQPRSQKKSKKKPTGKPTGRR